MARASCTRAGDSPPNYPRQRISAAFWLRYTTTISTLVTICGSRKSWAHGSAYQHRRRLGAIISRSTVASASLCLTHLFHLFCITSPRPSRRCRTSIPADLSNSDSLLTQALAPTAFDEHTDTPQLLTHRHLNGEKGARVRVAVCKAG